MKSKKTLLFTVALSFILSSLVIVNPAFADNLQENVIVLQSPRYVHINKATSELSVSGSNAIIKTTLLGKTGTTKTTITSVLQKKVSNKWENIASWTASSNSKLCTLSKTKAISKGTYRVSSTVTAYKGSVSEKDTLLSSSKTY
ncbi:hypothetical protein IC213_19400 [Clostridioides sp. ES-S-0049-02]|uniref:hypothetical protein n=1 Tax=Clostridioides sp. ES-S-0049-02 TaxID=2770778 RepID=UPI001D0F908E|nr:hypothetical protein [Clostridioides sp. ES-S-0049-02]